MTKTLDLRQNQLLAALPPEEFARLAPSLEKVSLTRLDVLCEPGVQLRHIYFPTTSIVALAYGAENGDSSEIVMVGNEGVVGVALFMGGQTALSRAVVRSAGEAYRLRGEVLNDEFCRGEALQSLLLRYSQALLTQMAQSLFCCRYHTPEQQLSRWLLQLFDRLPSGQLAITQELIAMTLGMRRGSVSVLAGNLQKAGVISYRRGCITLLDRAGLAARSCVCYAVVRREFDRLLPALVSSAAAP